MQNAPRGGARDLAISDADLSKGAQISNLTTGSYTNAFPSLASLGGQNVGQGNSATSTGLQGLNSAANQYGNLQELNNQQKSTPLGFASSLAGAGASLRGHYNMPVNTDQFQVTPYTSTVPFSADAAGCNLVDRRDQHTTIGRVRQKGDRRTRHWGLSAQRLHAWSSAERAEEASSGDGDNQCGRCCKRSCLSAVSGCAHEGRWKAGRPGGSGRVSGVHDSVQRR